MMRGKWQGWQNSRQRDYRRIGTWLSLILLAAAILCFAVVLNRTFDCRVNSDDAGELILSSLLAKEHRIITPDWYYSTELRVLNTQLVFAPLFFFTNNWHVIRVAGALILVLILACSTVYMCRGMGFRQGAVLVALSLCVPVSAEYYQFVIERSYYIPHVSTMFLTIGMMLRLNRQERLSSERKQFTQGLNHSQEAEQENINRTQYTKRRLKLRARISERISSGGKPGVRPRAARIVLCFLSFLLALGTGLGGPRLIILFYLPLFLTTAVVWAQAFFSETSAGEEAAGTVFVDTNQRLKGLYVAFAFLSLCGAAAGYLINGRFLSGIYHYTSYEDMSFISFHFERFLTALTDFLGSFGWRTGPVSMATLISNAIAGLLFAGSFFFAFRNAFFRKDKETQGLRYLSLLYLISVFVYCCLYGFTGMAYLTRYNLPVAVLALPVTGMSLCRMIRKTASFERWELMWRIAGICGCALAVAVFWKYSEVRNQPGTDKYILAEDYLSSNQYGTVYASFWNGNLFTELSDGSIRARAFTDNMEGAQDIDAYFEWLQVVDPETPGKDERVAFVLTEDEVDHCKWKCNLRDEDLVFSDEDLRIYGFENYDAMISRFYGSYVYHFEDNSIFKTNAEDNGNSRVLYPGGSSFGPNILLKPGSYRIEVKGSGLVGAVSYCTSEVGQHQYKAREYDMITEGDQQTLSYIIENDSDALNFEIIVQNPSSDEVRIDSIRMDQISD